MKLIIDFFLKLWIWRLFLIHRNSLPTQSNIENPKMEFELSSGTFFWEDEGLMEAKYQLGNAFKYVIHYRMILIAGDYREVDYLRSPEFEKKIFNLAQKFFPDWIGFHPSRCSYNPELANRMKRISKVAYSSFEKSLDEYDKQENQNF